MTSRNKGVMRLSIQELRQAIEALSRSQYNKSCRTCKRTKGHAFDCWVGSLLKRTENLEPRREDGRATGSALDGEVPEETTDL